jgi:hypothetical protein
MWAYEGVHSQTFADAVLRDPIIRRESFVIGIGAVA